MTIASTPRPADLLELAVTLAHGAGQVARAGREAEFEVTSKTSPTDVVTEVDRRVETWLREQIESQRPGDAVLGEEQGSGSGSGAVRWVLDPIDGTVNFLLGLPQYAVSVAAEVEGRVVAGCVHNPVSGESYRAHLGGGAWLDGRRLHGPREVPLARAVVGTGFSYLAARRVRQASVVTALIGRIADVRRAGSSSLDLCAVAAGRLDAYFEAGLNPWDYAAGLLIVQEAGGVVSGLRGRAPSGTMTVASGPALAGPLAAVLEELQADRVGDASD